MLKKGSALCALSQLSIEEANLIEPTLPAVLLEHACSLGSPIRVLEPRATNGNVNLLELVVLNHLVAHASPSVIFEMGTFDGRTTVNLAANAPKAKVFTIDLPKSQVDNTALSLEQSERYFIEKERSGARFAAHASTHQITQLFGDTATFDFSTWYDKVDFVFVDASHAAAYVRNDTEIALKMLRKGGMIVWHDYGSWTGVTEVLNAEVRENVRLRNLVQIHPTTLAVCGPESFRRIATSNDSQQARAYLKRYPDVQAGYDETERLGAWKALGHYLDFGSFEGRIWGV